MAKTRHRTATPPPNPLASLRSSVSDVRDLFDGRRGLGIDIPLADSIGKVTAAYSAVLSKNNVQWEKIAAELGNPSDETCEFVIAHLRTIMGAVFRGDRSAVQSSVAALEERSFMATLEQQVETSSQEFRDREAVSRARASVTVIHNLANGSKARPPMRAVPSGSFQAGGYGLAPVGNWDRRREAMRDVLAALDATDMPPARRAARFVEVADIFEAVAVCDTRDWYSLSRFLGHPASEHCRPLANAFRGLAEAVQTSQSGLYGKLREFVLDNYAGEMIESFNGIASGDPYNPEEGMVYIAWSASARNAIQIGVADGTVETELRELDRESGNGSRHGLLAAWLVHDVDHARDTLSGMLRHGLRSDGSYILPPWEARAIISTGLAKSDNLVLSPWHDENDTTPKQVPRLSMG